MRAGPVKARSMVSLGGASIFPEAGEDISNKDDRSEDYAPAAVSSVQPALVLVRPDQFVAWASDDSTVNATEILRRTIGAD